MAAKNKKLKQDKDRYQAEAAEWKKKYEELETKLEATKPSMLYRTLDKMGLVSLKKTLVNTSAIVGVVVVIYAISWMWKHLIKPTYYNFKGESKPPTQTSPFTQTKTFTHSPSHSPQIIKEVVREEQPVRVIEPARSDQAGHPQSNPPKPKTNKSDKLGKTKSTENLDQSTETKKTQKNEKEKGN